MNKFGYEIRATKRRAAAIVLAAMVCLLATSAVFAATITVNTTADNTTAGDTFCTLREAIINANANSDASSGDCFAGTGAGDIITFDITSTAGAGPHTISPPSSDLPFITEAVTIDGYTETGAAPATTTTDATIMIVLDGSGLSGPEGTGLFIGGGSGSVIKGLAIRDFAFFGIRILVSTLNTIEGNFIGTDVTGTSAAGNETGVLIEGTSNTVGGSTPAARNIISGNNEDGVFINIGDRNDVFGNYIGTDVTGTAALGNGRAGVHLQSGARFNNIGGPNSGEGNVISANGFGPREEGGVRMERDANNNTVQANLIGTDVTGILPLSNSNFGVVIETNSNFINDNVIAFTVAGNFGPGIGIGVTGIDNLMSANSIHSNAALGIDLGNDGVTANDDKDPDSGGNNLQNFPVLTSATGTATSLTITGDFNSTPSTPFSFIEFFASDVCNGNVAGTEETDPALRFGEGKTPIGVVEVSTDADGNASFSVTLPVSVPDGAVITATVTSGEANTSEFSECVVAQVQTLPHDFLFLAEEFVESKKHKLLQGDIHSNNDIFLKKGKKSDVVGDLFAVDDIDIGKKNDIDGNLTAGHEVDNDGHVSGTITENAGVTAVPLPVIGPFAVGTTSIEVAKKATLALAPDSYGNVEVEKQGTLELTSGTYFMKSLELNKKTKLIIDVSSGDPVIINISDDLVFGKRSEVIIEPNGEADSELVTFNFADDDDNNGDDDFVEIGKKAKVLGTIIAPDAWVVLQSKSRFKGTICAENIVVKSKVVALHHSVTTSLPKAAPGEEDEDELNLTSVPTEFELGQNYPNPFNPSTTINFAVPRAGDVTLAIYNLRGQLVTTLHQGALAAGRHRMVWDGKDTRGQQAATGVYVYRLEAKDFVATKKLTLMK